MQDWKGYFDALLGPSITCIKLNAEQYNNSPVKSLGLFKLANFLDQKISTIFANELLQILGKLRKLAESRKGRVVLPNTDL